MWKYILSGLTGCLVVIVVFFLFQKFFLSHNHSYKVCDSDCPYVTHYSQAHEKIHADSSMDIKIGLANTEERVNSINKRIDDLYVLGSIIVTLMLVLIAGVYVRADHDVENHLNQNFEKHKDQIEQHLKEAERMVGNMKSSTALEDVVNPDHTDSNFDNP